MVATWKVFERRSGCEYCKGGVVGVGAAVAVAAPAADHVVGEADYGQQGHYDELASFRVSYCGQGFDAVECFSESREGPSWSLSSFNTSNGNIEYGNDVNGLLVVGGSMIMVSLRKLYDLMWFLLCKVC